MKRSISIWIRAARPKTLWAAFSPVVLGAAFAAHDGVWHGPSLLAAALAAGLIQVGTNLCNDWADFHKGADTAERIGPVRITQAGLASPRAVLAATILVFTLAGLVSLYLVARGGWPIAVLAAASIASGALYTVGPAPLGYTGLADLFVLVFFGPVAVAGTYYVQALELSAPVVAAGLGPGLLSVAILTVNNLRDREGDARAGKKTLVVRLGRTFGLAEYAVCLAGALGLAAGLALVSRAGVGALLPLVLAPWAWRLFDGIRTTTGAALNPYLGRTARFLLVYCILVSIGVLL